MKSTPRHAPSQPPAPPLAADHAAALREAVEKACRGRVRTVSGEKDTDIDRILAAVSPVVAELEAEIARWKKAYVPNGPFHDLQREIYRLRDERDTLRARAGDAELAARLAQAEAQAQANYDEMADTQNRLAQAEAEVARLKHALFIEEQNRNQLAIMGYQNTALRAYAAQLKEASEGLLLQFSEIRTAKLHQALALPVPGDERKTP